MLIKYLPTTFFLLSWCIAFALLWLSICILMLKSGHIQLLKFCHRPLLFLPVMIIAPLLLIVVFRGAGINLLFPIHLFAQTSELLIAAAVPGIVLFFA